jgi:hypothetical protein
MNHAKAARAKRSLCNATHRRCWLFLMAAVLLFGPVGSSSVKSPNRWLIWSSTGTESAPCDCIQRFTATAELLLTGLVSLSYRGAFPKNHK